MTQNASASAKVGASGGHVGEVGVMARDAGEQRPGPGMVARPFFEVRERVPEAQVVLARTFHRAGLACQQLDRLGETALVG